jgi:hypothetical protein
MKGIKKPVPKHKKLFSPKLTGVSRRWVLCGFRLVVFGFFPVGNNCINGDYYH